MSFNLNNTLSFAQVTQSVPSNTVALAASQLANLSGLLGGGQWQIQEASFNGAKFHIFKGISSFSDAGAALSSAFSTAAFTGTSAPAFAAGLHNVSDASGRRKAVFKFPYKDGQTTVDLGRDGETWTFDCIFFGPNYKTGWDAFYEQLAAQSSKTSTGPGTLIHPVRGALQAVPKSWQFTYTSDVRKAIAVRVVFIEHTFTVNTKPTANTPSILDNIKTGLNAGIAALNTLNSAIAYTVGVLTTPLNILSAVLAAPSALRASLVSDMVTIANLFGVTLQRSNATYNVGNSIDLPAIVTVNSGGTALTTGAQAATSVSVTISPTGSSTTPSSTSPYTTAEAVADANTYSAAVASLIEQIEEANLEFLLYQQLLDFQASAVTLQQIIAIGIKTAQPLIVQYTLPRDMSLREVAFQNGLTPNDFPTISQMNPGLDSVNNVSRGTVLQVPVGLN